MNAREKRHLIQDFIIVSISVLFAIWLSQNNTIETFLSKTAGFSVLESFIAGMFFTSAFTTAPAIVVLGEISQTSSVLLTAFIGALGALFGDLILFTFVRERFSDDLFSLIGKKETRRIKHIFERKLFRWFSPFVAALIIASPLPDELGILLLGMVKTKTGLFVPFSFFANFTGILIIAAIASFVA